MSIDDYISLNMRKVIGGLIQETLPSAPPPILTPADMLSVVGMSPSAMLTFQETSGNVIDLVTAQNLVPTSAIQGQTTTLGDGSLCLRFSGDAGSGAAAAADTSHYDVGLSSFAFLMSIELITPPAANRTTLQKFVGGLGYRLELSSAAVKFTADDGPTSAVAQINVPLAGTGWRSILLICNRTSNTTSVMLDSGETNSSGVTLTNSLNTATAFDLGQPADSPDIRLRHTSQFIGAGVETFTQDTLNAFHARLQA